MPIYSYKCDTCAHEFELKQGFDAESIHPCPQCENTARRVFFPVGVIYKGSGFYTTDYKRASESKAGSRSSNGSSSSADGASSAASSSETNSDSTPSTTASAASD